MATKWQPLLIKRSLRLCPSRGTGTISSATAIAVTLPAGSGLASVLRDLAGRGPPQLADGTRGQPNTFAR